MALLSKISELIDQYDLIIQEKIQDYAGDDKYIVKNKKDGQLYFLKIKKISLYSKEDSERKVDMDKIISVLDKWKEIINTCLIHLYNYIVFEDILLLIVDYYKNGSIDDFFSDEKFKLYCPNYMNNLIDTLFILYNTYHLYHGNLKLSNILLTNDFKNIILTDINIYQLVDKFTYHKLKSFNIDYYLPQGIKSEDAFYSDASETWVLGILLSQLLLSQKYPFNQNELIHINTELLLNKFSSIDKSSIIIGIIMFSLIIEPDKRATITRLYNLLHGIEPINIPQLTSSSILIPPNEDLPNVDVKQYFEVMVKQNPAYASLIPPQLYYLLFKLANNTDIKELTLSNYCMASKPNEFWFFISQLLSCYRHIKILKLSNCRLTNNDSYIFPLLFNGMRQITDLYLDNNNFTHDSCHILLDGLIKLPHLEILDLSYNPLGPYGLSLITSFFKSSNQLTTLKLASCNLHYSLDNLIVSLPYFQSLSCLSLSENKMNEKQFYGLSRSFKDLPNLSSLSLQRTNMNFLSIGVLAYQFIYLGNLQTLNLDGNEIGERGCFSLAQNLKYLLKLTEFSVEENNISQIGSKQLLSSIKDLTNLRILFIGVNEIKQLGALELSKLLPNLKNLSSLGIGGNSINDESISEVIKSFVHVPGLSYLKLSFNEMGGIGCQELAKLLGNLTNIRELHIDTNPLRDQGVIVLSEKMSSLVQLQDFNISDCQMSDAGLVPLLDNLRLLETLETLDLSYNLISGISFDYIERNNMLFPHIRQLILERNSIDAEGCTRLSRIIPNFRSLAHLVLANNSISDIGMIELSNTLQFCTTLHKLDVQSNGLTNFCLSIFLNNILSCYDLETLLIGGNPFNNQSINDIKFYLSNTTNLNEFSILNTSLSSRYLSSLVQEFQSIRIVC